MLGAWWTLIAILALVFIVAEVVSTHRWAKKQGVSVSGVAAVIGEDRQRAK